MISPIFSDGKEYISASRAAKKIGYASDYIGQLCRAKKVPGQLIGRTWYVDFASLTEHKKNRQFGKMKKLVVREYLAPLALEKKNCYLASSIFSGKISRDNCAGIF